jgi:predicted MFS family arabinose efflux permease
MARIVKSAPARRLDAAQGPGCGAHGRRSAGAGPRQTRLNLDPARLRGALWATRIEFLALGALTGAWGVHIPSAKAHYALGEAALAGLLLAAAAGVVLSLAFAGRIVARLGARGAARAGAVLMAGALALVLVMPNLPVGLLVMLMLGAGSSVLDMAINTEGSVLESVGGRAVMSGLHGMFSLGGMAGAAVCAAMLHAGLAPALQLALFGAAVGALALAAAPRMLDAHPDAAQGQVHFVWPRGPLLWIGLLIFAGMTAEGVMYDWSVLYMKQELGQPQAFAALAYTSFSATMAAARFGGDALRERFAEKTLLQAGAVAAALAMAVVLLVGHPWVALIGFAVVGAGLACVAPILFNAAARVPGTSRAAAIAAATSIGYSGFMIGPPLIGFVAQASSLTWALGVIVLAAAALAVGARRVPAKAGA